MKCYKVPSSKTGQSLSAPSTCTCWHGPTLKMQLCTCWRECRSSFSSYGKPEDGQTSHWKHPTIIRHDPASSGFVIFENLSMPLDVVDDMAYMEMPASYFRPPWSRWPTELLAPYQDGHYDHENYVFQLVQVQFTDDAVTHTGTPAVDAAVGTGPNAHRVNTITWGGAQALKDLDNTSFWIVGDIREGGSVVSLFLADNRRHRTWRELRLIIYISPTSPSSSTPSNTALALLKHHDLYRLKFVVAGEGAYIEPRAVFRIAGSGERSPQFDGDMFRRTERRSSHVDSIAPSYGELDERANRLFGQAGRRSPMHDARGNHYLIIMDAGPRGSLTLTARTGLSHKCFNIRIKTLLQDFTKLGELGEPMVDPFVEHFFFDTTTAGHNHLRIIHSTPPQDDFNIAKLYEIGGVSTTYPSTTRVDTWPKGADVSTATYSGESHSSGIIFTDRVTNPAECCRLRRCHHHQ